MSGIKVPAVLSGTDGSRPKQVDEITFGKADAGPEAQGLEFRESGMREVKVYV